MANSRCFGWLLLFAGLVLLAGFRQLDLLVILVPLSILVACVMTRLEDNTSGLTDGIKKR
ncbi:MAG TPA: hypothetical protein VMT28_02450 [Terriglobales bacterium]|jgi:hypothetical protein|nr:hypothetical protein [Terriglobales bacterium]